MGAFPQLRPLGLLENRTHVITRAQIGAYGVSNRALALPILQWLTGELLCLADRAS